MNRKDYLETAMDIICRQRLSVHGTPEDSFSLVASYWSAYLGTRLASPAVISAADVAMMMSLFKTARWQMNPDHADNLVDNLGYVALAGELSDATPYASDLLPSRSQGEDDHALL